VRDVTIPAFVRKNDVKSFAKNHLTWIRKKDILMDGLTTWDAFFLSPCVEATRNWWDPVIGSMRAFLPTSLFAVLLLAPDTNALYHDDAGALQYVNPKVGTLGYSLNGNGGMIPLRKKIDKTLSLLSTCR
jgi:hypothetical protein